MSNWLTDIGNFMDSSAGKGLTSLAGVGLGAYGLYNQNKAMNAQNDLIAQQNNLAQQNYLYNKSINDREIAKENLAQENKVDGFNSVFGNQNQKKKQLGSYYGTTNYSA